MSLVCQQVLKMMVGNNLKDTQLQQIVDKTILFADRDEDGKINFEEFCSVSTHVCIHTKSKRICFNLLIHCGRVMQICVYTLQLCKTDDANLRFF